MVALRRMPVLGSLALLAGGAYLTIGLGDGSRRLFAQIPNVDSISPLPSLPPLSNPPAYRPATSAPPPTARLPGAGNVRRPQCRDDAGADVSDAEQQFRQFAIARRSGVG